jgi:hypothetical protein
MNDSDSNKLSFYFGRDGGRAHLCAAKPRRIGDARLAFEGVIKRKKTRF